MEYAIIIISTDKNLLLLLRLIAIIFFASSFLSFHSHVSPIHTVFVVSEHREHVTGGGIVWRKNDDDAVAAHTTEPQCHQFYCRRILVCIYQFYHLQLTNHSQFQYNIMPSPFVSFARVRPILPMLSASILFSTSYILYTQTPHRHTATPK